MTLDLDAGLPDEELPLRAGRGRGWSVAETRVLETLWADPALSAANIAMRLPGRTRNAIIGKAHALGLPEKAAKPKRGKRVPTSIANEGLRKAFARKGDDATLARFVKVAPGPVHPKPRQSRMQGFDNPTIEAGRSIFYRHGVHPPRLERPKSNTAYRVLVSAHNNAKIGRDVRKGKLRGYRIFTLSLEERATCPRSCEHWGNCYGNGMPYARRVDHRDRDALETAIRADIVDMMAVRGWPGVLVRLHALGDFYDERYADFWGGLVREFPRLVVFGYTAHPVRSPVGQRIAHWRDRLGFERFAVRHSDGGLRRDCTVSIYDLQAPPGAFICPEQAVGVTAAGKPILCATCALCWTTRRNVAFVNH